MKVFDAIIIGGGVSGLACGKTLHEHGIDFCLVTKEIGGRMLTSQSHEVNYGASYITSEYGNIAPYMGGGKRIRTNDCYFQRAGKSISFFRWRTALEIPKLIKLYFIAMDFKKRLRNLRKNALFKSQKECLESDAVLKEYTAKTAVDFVMENNLQYLNDTYFSSLFNSTGFIEYDKCNAFSYLDNLMALFCKTYVADHGRCCHLMPKGWEDKIITGEVSSLKRNSNKCYVIEAEGKEFRATNVVLALPHSDAEYFYDAPKPKHNVPIHVLEVSGVRHEPFQNQRVVFFRPEGNDITILWAQSTGTDVIFSKVSNPPLQQYYRSHKVENHVFWKTAVVLSGDEWCEQILDEGLYLASDYNICGLEDAFITGVYSANKIIERTSLAKGLDRASSEVRMAD